MRKNIAITDAELFIARRGVRTRCAIAAAIMTQIPSARHIKVDQETISWLDVDRRERLIFRTPLSARQFIEAWDEGREVAGFAFSLTDTALLERREPRSPGTATRITRKSQQRVLNPGSRMVRHPSDRCDA
jgi:hypothetical protein